jgi:hypothetical protein
MSRHRRRRAGERLAKSLAKTNKRYGKALKKLAR